MRPVIVIRAPLREWWATDEQLRDMTTAEVIELVHEDLLGLMEDAEFRVEWPDGGFYESSEVSDAK